MMRKTLTISFWKIAKQRFFIVLLCMVLILFLTTSSRSKRVPKTRQAPVKEPELYNLLSETEDKSTHVKSCTLDYVNKHKLQQDHPCVLEIIRDKYLKPPSPPEVPLELNFPNTKDPSAGQVTALMRFMRNMTNGFYVESGAADGESFSNTLFLEQSMNWTGLLVEPEPTSFSKLTKRNRKSWTVPACLSLEKFPTAVSFNTEEIVGKVQGDAVSLSPDIMHKKKLVNVQCFPLYSLLLAHNRTSVDFFSLDVEGHELKVLKTIPWHKLDIGIVMVEWEHVREGYWAIVDYMKEHGYVNFGNIATPYARDVVFIKDHLRDLRKFEFDLYDYDEESAVN